MKDKFSNSLAALKERIVKKEQEKEELQRKKQETIDEIKKMESTQNNLIKRIKKRRQEYKNYRNYEEKKCENISVTVNHVAIISSTLLLINTILGNNLLSASLALNAFTIAIVLPLDIIGIKLINKKIKIYKKRKKVLEEEHQKYSNIEEIKSLIDQEEEKIENIKMQIVLNVEKLKQLNIQILDVNKKINYLKQEIKEFQNVFLKSLAKIENKEVEQFLDKQFEEGQKRKDIPIEPQKLVLKNKETL